MFIFESEALLLAPSNFESTQVQNEKSSKVFSKKVFCKCKQIRGKPLETTPWLTFTTEVPNYVP